MLNRAQVQGFALAIVEWMDPTIHVRFQQVDAALNRDQVEGVDISGMGML